MHTAHLLGSVAATIAPEAAEDVVWHAIIVGAGPAGGSTAARLAARGLRTLLVDRHSMPRGKVCGCCLSSDAAAELRDLARTPAAAAIDGLSFAPLETVRLMNRGHEAVLTLTGGGVVSRESLDSAIVRGAVDAGAAWLPRCQVTAIDDPSDETSNVGVTLLGTGDGTEPRPLALRAEYVVIATGLSDQVRIRPHGHPSRGGRTIAVGSRVGIGAVLPAEAIETHGLPAGQLVMAIHRDGYCGIVRLEDGRIDLAAALDRSAVSRHGDPADALVQLVVETVGGSIDPGAFVAGVRGVPMRATPSLTRMAALVAGSSGRIVRVGDAAGYVEPFTGEGIGWALAGGRLLADALVRGRSSMSGAAADPARVATLYGEAYRRHFEPRHRRCRRVVGLLRRPVAVAAAVGAARMMPSIAKRLVPVVVGAGAPFR